ncbi:hypothetical protein HU200_060803 [Digitaria exilis]|uniref:Leucine-rich repeat-containing N-terminal plant-type domain-containing protein n=1 Tax=Digitaria exilis TaxID=1010633 RepID=A0A835AA57_9POAL|nr:hypothetical protein HU200_060803 [Digitaria exilis]
MAAPFAICLFISGGSSMPSKSQQITEDSPRTTRMKNTTRALFALVLVVSSILACAPSAAAGEKKKRCHAGDKAALLALKAALGNPYLLASWTSDTSCCDDWYDVSCDGATGRVIGISLSQDDNVTGAIPAAIANLTHLTSLTFHHLPGITAPIPPAIAKLSGLSMLIISWTGVSGPVPSFLGSLTSLTFLDLSFNSLSGSIPASLAALPNLSGINLSRNRLSGPIPTGLFSQLLSPDQQQVYLWLSHNNLSGTIPTGFDAVRFEHVDVSRNALSGDASVLFGAGKALQYADLSRNALSFNLSALELPERQLVGVDMSHNAIYGGIPPQVANMAGLQQFNVSYNRLCGQVPLFAANIAARFDVFSFQHNKCLCGTPLPTPCK